MCVARPGGYIAYTLRRDIYEANGCREEHAGLKEAGKAKVIEATNPRRLMPIGEPGMKHRVWVLKVV